MQRRHLLALPLAMPFLSRAARAQGGVPVVASFSILGDMVRQIGGGRVSLRVIAGPDVDAHSFQPRPADAEAVRGARLVVRNGLGFDTWLDRLVRSAGYRGPVATASEGITPRALQDNHGHGHSHAQDPHAWQDLRHGQSYVRAIAAALVAADPEGAEGYRARAEAYLARLAALDAWVRQQIATVPEARRQVVTSHDAFGYFANAYGVRFLAPQGISTDSEPSAAEVARLIRLLKQQNITALFLENMANPATLRRLAAEAGVTVHGQLYADALSRPDGPAPDYEAMFRHNLGLLVPAMKGEG
ncbi:metal ABC transporter solute-binding protein, Zn/Mn family [Pseudoroseomonas ludipueritiae]|uniref:Zinc ABC transporter substrate-binding protein n=1 Tax=Pseudoroseomonas ludipueritiae TaxID=198093 RepID=A0ABR7RAG2_9PROT|nr:zinc ABC transporter substrate-binding protein [Pseudoroseomonas ludipueritiae]MBC9178694.1 zinc ABC transporter substrate-binding protein [Pseudoroseomonas ludipueritiae]